MRPDKEVTLVLDEWAVGAGGMNMAAMAAHDSMGGGHAMMDYNVFTINGRSFPDSEPIMVNKGERVRLRLINAGTSTIHPMHLHGHQFKIVATDGNAVPQAAQLTKNTIALNPGETYDIEFTAENPGVWVFHCHELHHAGAGMIVPVIYEGYTPLSQ
ncbi:multicopper oxidase domain-containing protein [Candidatus Azambacteria bacterium]|nr:multicopper oxidase domain-containing protein [Candidatus Azambacteria bacterium]